MKKVTQITFAMVLLAGLCIGCSKSEKPETKPAQAAKTEKWEPETVALPEEHSPDDGHDHSGHDHSGHDHSGHDHSGHDHEDHAGHNH